MKEYDEGSDIGDVGSCLCASDWHCRRAGKAEALSHGGAMQCR